MSGMQAFTQTTKMKEILKKLNDIQGFAEDCEFQRAQENILKGQ